MDKRTVDGKKFNELETSDEKMLFLLEGIYDRLQHGSSTDYLLGEIQRTLKFVVELNINQLKIQNKNIVWTDDYIKELKQRLKYL